MIEWTLETRSLSSLTDHPHNPRQLSKHDAEHLEKSLSKFGVAEKLIINTDGQIIGGHQRKKILKKLGIKQIPCWVPSRTLTPEEVNELNIRLNRNQGEWDFDTLANEWELTDLLQWGFTAEEFELEQTTEKEEKDKKKKICPHCGEEL